MKVTLSAKELNNALSLFKDVISKKAAIPSLLNIKLLFTSEKLIIIGTDLENTLEVNIPVHNTDDEMEVLVDYEHLSKIIKIYEDEPIELLFENNIITIEGNTSVFDITYEDDLSTYPDTKIYNEHGRIDIDPSLLLNEISKCMPLVSDDELRPVMNCVHVYSDGNECVIEATNSYILRQIKTIGVVHGQIDALFSKKASKVLTKLNSEYTIPIDTLSQIIMYETKMQVNTEKYILTTTNYNDKYPNIASMLRDVEDDYKMKLNLGQLKKSVTKLSSLSYSESNLIIFKISDITVDIEIQDFDNSISGHIALDPINLGNKLFEIGMNSKKLNDLLSVIDGEFIDFYIKDNSEAIILTVDDNKNDLSLIMPLKLN